MKKHLIIALMAILPVACSGSNDAAKLDPAAVAAGKAVFAENFCATCHGETGAGDGVAAAGLPVKPRDYSDAKWQAATTDEQLKKVLTEGGAANGLSILMAAYPNIVGDDLNNLVAFIRSMKK
ncbi:MAG: mono/diheme cytochrome c family protein [Planctomycetota bacterium]|jgi:mono/diheme cytochrome c family protein